MSRHTRIWPVLVAIAVALAACGGAGVSQQGSPGGSESAAASAAASAAGAPIRIGLVFDITGSSAFLNNQAVQGAQLAVAEVNSDGGVLGRRIEAPVQDSQCEPVAAGNAARRLIEVDKAKLIIGAGCSSATLAIMPIVKELGAVEIVSLSSAPSISAQAGVGGNPQVFRINPHDAIYAPALADAIVGQSDLKVAIVSTNDDFGRGAAGAFATQLQAKGATVTEQFFFDRAGAFDFNSILTKIRASDATGIIFTGTREPGVPFVHQLNELQMKQHIYTRSLDLSAALFTDLGQQADGLYSTDPWYSAIDSPENATFKKAFGDKWGVDPTFGAYLAYTAVKLYAQAIKSAGSDEPSAVKDALEKASFQAVTGKIAFDDHHQAYLPVYLAQVACDPTCHAKIVRVVDTNP
jgi:branched-chain amino acid transport system substrate-binding protein